jgi:putative membrane protein
MTAITTKDYKIIGAIAVGVIIGLLSFARLLKWLFLNYKNQMLIVLTGIMLGSLNKVWPWKEAISTYIDRHGVTKPLVEQSIFPVSFDGDPKLISAIILAIVGFGLILLMEKLAVKKE